MAPIFTPPRSVSAPEEPHFDLPRQFQEDVVPVQSFTPEQTKEAFDVARNSVELLSTVLSSSPEQDVLQVFFVCCVISCNFFYVPFLCTTVRSVCFGLKCVIGLLLIEHGLLLQLIGIACMLHWPFVSSNFTSYTPDPDHCFGLWFCLCF